MSSNVVWFADIGLADLETVGGKNSSLGEMVRELSSAGVRVPDGFATTAEAYRRFIGETGLAEMISGELRRPGHRRRAAARRGGSQDQDRRGRADLSRGPGSRHPGGVRATGRGRPGGVLRGPVQRHRRGPARRLVRRAAGDLPQRSGDRRHPDRHPRGVRVALQRPGHRVPGAPPLRARDGRPVGGRAADGAVRHRRVGRDVHHGHRVRVHRRGLHHLLVRAGRGGRPGRGESRRVLRLQARAAGRTPGDPQAQHRRQGDEDDLHRRPRGRQDHRVRRRRRGRPPPAQPDRRRSQRARPARAGHRGALRPADGHRVGQGRPGRSALHPAGAPGDGAVAAQHRRPAALPPRRTGLGLDRGSRHRPEDRGRRCPRALHRRGHARIRAR